MHRQYRSEWFSVASKLLWEQTVMTWTPRTLAEFVAEGAATRGDAEALVTPTARLTYAEQHRAVRRAAKAMHALGVRKGDFVGILLGNDRDLGDAVLRAPRRSAPSPCRSTRASSRRSWRSA